MQLFSVKNIKTRLCSIIKSLIKNVFPSKDLMFSKDSFNDLGALPVSFLMTGWGSRGMGVKFTKFAEPHRVTFVFLLPIKTEMEEALCIQSTGLSWKES